MRDSEACRMLAAAEVGVANTDHILESIQPPNVRYITG
jgi:hypothetical protein